MGLTLSSGDGQHLSKSIAPTSNTAESTPTSVTSDNSSDVFSLPPIHLERTGSSTTLPIQRHASSSSLSQDQTDKERETKWNLPGHMAPTSSLSDITTEKVRYVDKANEFSLEIMEGSVDEGQTLTVDVGVALFGSFRFPVGLRPVSPVFWVCVRDQPNFHFSTPAAVTIPHFLDLQNIGDVSSLGLTFLKADHHLNSDMKYHFQQADGDMNFEPLERCGVLKTNHFCSHCIACRDTPECLEKTKFCITAVLPNSTIPVGKKTDAFFFVIFLNLKTCLKRVDELISKEKFGGYEIMREEFQFKSCDSTDPAIEIDITQPKHGKIG